jgi:spore maturation protein A
MLNYLWGGMILLGVAVGAFTGRLTEVTNAAIASSKEAVTICITMLGILSMWTGIMRIASEAGLIRALTRCIMPILRFLFPTIPKGHKAMEYIATNFIANFLGLGWAATPPGIRAMEELQGLNKGKAVASREMCMFMVVNMSSLQLVGVNMLAYRAQYGSQSPSEIIGPGIFTTLVSTVAAIAFVKLVELWECKQCV